jgi:FkbM family methyltransferase
MPELVAPAYQLLEMHLSSAGESQTGRLRLDPSQFTQRLMLAPLSGGGAYESETAQLLLSTLRPGDTFIDVGAHIGYFTVLAALLVGASGHVVSFEPDYRNFEHLVAHLQNNALTNVRPFTWLVGESSGPTDLYLNADNDGGHAVWDVGAHPFNTLSKASVRRQPTYQTSLDDAPIGASARLRMLKVDTEGNELAVVRGARRVLSAADPLVILEVNGFGLAQNGTSEQELRAYMAELGFDSYALA